MPALTTCDRTYAVQQTYNYKIGSKSNRHCVRCPPVREASQKVWVERSRKHLRSPHPGFSFVALFTKEKSPLCAQAQRNSSANPQRAEKPENKGVDKTAIRKDAFHVNQTVFSEEDSQKKQVKKTASEEIRTEMHAGMRRKSAVCPNIVTDIISQQAQNVKGFSVFHFDFFYSNLYPRNHFLPIHGSPSP